MADRKYVIVNQEDFDRNFHHNIAFPNIAVLQTELDYLVNRLDESLSKNGRAHSETVKYRERLSLLKSKLFAK